MNPLKKHKKNFKSKVAKRTGIPTTKSGRKKKGKSAIGGLWVVLIGLMVMGWLIKTVFGN